MTNYTVNQERIFAANKRYTQRYDAQSNIDAKPTRKFAVLTCMDARMDPAQFAGIAQGEAHVIRNAGGKASDDAIRSLVISHKLLGTTEWFIIQHTRCGMATITDNQISQLLAESLDPAYFGDGTWHNSDTGPGSDAGFQMQWHCISDLETSIRDDVMKIANHPLVSRKISISGYVYDVSNGEMRPVTDASRPGLQ